MLRPIYFLKKPVRGAYNEVNLAPLKDHIQAKFSEAKPTDNRWDIVGKLKQGQCKYKFLQEQIANCLQVDSRVPLGYLIEDYVEQCPYELEFDPEFEPKAPEQFQWEVS